MREAASGPEGLLVLEQDPPDLILLDVMMPQMDGGRCSAASRSSTAARSRSSCSAARWTRTRPARRSSGSERVHRQAVRSPAVDRPREADPRGAPGLISVDRSLDRWIVEHRSDWLDPLFVGLSIAGSWAAVWLGIALALAIAWRRPNVFLLVATTALTRTSSRRSSSTRCSATVRRPSCSTRSRCWSSEHLVVPLGPHVDELRVRLRDLAPGAAPDRLRLRARRADRLLADLRRRPLPARRARGSHPRTPRR